MPVYGAVGLSLSFSIYITILKYTLQATSASRSSCRSTFSDRFTSCSEAAPVNSFPRNTTSTSLSSQWVFDAVGADWMRWAGAQAADQVVHQSGSYSAKVPGTNLRLFSGLARFKFGSLMFLACQDHFLKHDILVQAEVIVSTALVDYSTHVNSRV